MLDRELVEAVKLAREAGALSMKVYATDFDVDYKGKADPVTEADRLANEHIVRRLRESFPNDGLVAEETEDKSDARKRGRCWYVDPLDGTKEFVKRNGEFSVNIALVEAGVPVLGVVHAPVAGVTYVGVAAHADQPASAWRFDAEGGGHPIHVRPPVEGEAVRVMVSRSHSNAATDEYIDRLRRRHGKVETMACGSALKSCLVADGTAHFYPRLGPTMWWDTAAAQAVLEAAGGEMLAVGGEPLRYAGDVLSNPGFVAESGVDRPSATASDLTAEG